MRLHRVKITQFTTINPQTGLHNDPVVTYVDGVRRISIAGGALVFHDRDDQPFKGLAPGTWLMWEYVDERK